MIPTFSASTRMIDAMGLALGRVDATAAAAVLAALREEGLPEAKREDLHRRLLSAAKLVAVNCRAGTMLGITEADLPVAISVFWPFAQAEALAQSLGGMLDPQTFFHAELCLRAPDGELHVRYTSWREEGAAPGEVTIGLLNISDQVMAEKDAIRLRSQMAHADRLSTLGIMTATIAHEVRQPLSAIMTSAQAALRWLDRDVARLDQIEDCLNNIVDGAGSAEQTIARLRSMASNRLGNREVIAVAPLIEETADFLHQELATRQAALLLDVAPGLPLVVADGVQIRQVLINLMINAAQAMAEASCWSRAIKIRARLDGRSVLIDVEDSGPGIPVEARQHLFDGFFTTKAEGLGLGLRICRQILEDHKGTLEHVPKGAAGSIFRLTLPAAP